MQSHRRPRGKIFFEVLCAVTVGASFVGAWIQTGAWAFLGPAFIFTLFGLYWSFDMFGPREPALASVQPAAPMAEAVRAGPLEEQVEQPASAPELGFAPPPDEEPRPKRRARKTKAEAVAEEPAPAPIEEPVFHDAPIEQLFEPQPFVRQQRPAFGRKSGGSRPLPAA